MKFMNGWEIEEAAERFRDHPTLGPATRTLRNLRDAADANSDGWAYWPLPARSAKKLMELIEGEGWEGRFGPRDDVTPAQVKAALRPVKAFRTRHGIEFEIEEVTVHA